MSSANPLIAEWLQPSFAVWRNDCRRPWLLATLVANRVGGPRRRLHTRDFLYRSERRAGTRAKSSTRIPAEIATAATCAISTALSPTTWQPNIFAALRSTTSLQNPVLRPSIIVRMVESKITTSCVSRAFASERPAHAYSGYVNPLVVFSSARTGTLVAAAKPSCIAGRTSMR